MAKDKKFIYTFAWYKSKDKFVTYTCGVSGDESCSVAVQMRRQKCLDGYACGAIRKVPAPEQLNFIL